MSAKITNNIIRSKNDSDSTEKTNIGIECGAHYNEIKLNQVTVINTRPTISIGIYIDADKAVIESNKVTMDLDSTTSGLGPGTSLSISGCSELFSLKSNDIVHSDKNPAGDKRGIYIYGCSNGNVSLNNVDMVNGDSRDIGIYLNNTSSNIRGTKNSFYNCGTNISDHGTSNYLNISGGGTF